MSDELENAKFNVVPPFASKNRYGEVENAREEEAVPCFGEPATQSGVDKRAIVGDKNSTSVLVPEAINVAITASGRDTNSFTGAPHGAPRCTIVNRLGRALENFNDVPGEISRSLAHIMAGRQFDESPDVIQFAEVAAAWVYIEDVIRELSTLCTALDPFCVRKKCTLAPRKCLNMFLVGPRKTFHLAILDLVEIELIER